MVDQVTINQFFPIRIILKDDNFYTEDDVNSSYRETRALVMGKIMVSYPFKQRWTQTVWSSHKQEINEKD